MGGPGTRVKALGRQVDNHANRQVNLSTMSVDMQPLKSSSVQNEGAPQAVGWALLSVHKGLWVSWQSGQVAGAPGARVPGPPEKEQVRSRAISPEGSVGQTGWI